MLDLKHGPVRQKSVLVLSGEGPYFKNSSYYDGTMFDLHGTRALAPELHGHPLSGLRLTDLTYSDGSQLRPLLRPNRGAEPHLTAYTLEAEPHLTSYTLESILMAAERPSSCSICGRSGTSSVNQPTSTTSSSCPPPLFVTGGHWVVP